MTYAHDVLCHPKTLCNNFFLPSVVQHDYLQLDPPSLFTGIISQGLLEKSELFSKIAEVRALRISIRSTTACVSSL